MAAATAYPATDKQINFLRKLVQDRETGWDLSQVVEFGLSLDAGAITKKDASDKISWLLTRPKAAKPAPTANPDPATEEGVYQNADGDVYKVKLSKTDHLYAMVWRVSSGEHLNAEGDHVKGTWEYAPGAIHTLQASDRMTLDQAKAFILMYGQCARCGRKLSAAKSVEAGIGPVCIKYFSF